MSTKEEFRKRGIAKSDNKSINYFNDICPDFYAVKYTKFSEYINTLWTNYERLGINDNAINGTVFEYILVSLLIRENIFPFYYQAELSFVKNVKFDVFFWSEAGPITLSIKTSLRERYKQAVLEADTMISTHSKSYNTLISLDKDAIKTVNEKIIEKDIRSLEKALYVYSDDFDRFIYFLKSQKLLEAPMVNIVNNKQAFVNF